ncbi:MAG: helix-turn-helix transcriptional regulator, partial [Actinobacteria bacterium]|nr:helix-turn-helix transcriptional regulator [Actinomycetota bacterium]
AGFKAPLLEALCRSQLALIALDRGDRSGACAEAERARARVARRGLPDYPVAAVVYAVSACVLAEQGTSDRAGLDLRAAESLFAQLDDHATWLEVETRTLMARAHAGLGHRREAEEHLAAAAGQASRVPDAPALVGWIAGAREAAAGLGSSGAELLTPAELRILQMLPTHLSLPEIGESLCVSPNTVKTHTRNIYAKFGVSSRRAAVARADRDGLLAQGGPAFAVA